MDFNNNEYVDVTSVDIHKLCREAYDLSVPQGLGYLQPYDEPLSDEQIDEMLAYSTRNLVIGMDYVNGRAVKLNVYKSDDGKRYIQKQRWYDHSLHQYEELLSRLGVEENIAA